MADQVPIEEQAKCVRREIRMREHAYPRWVDQGKMTQQKADEELAAMRAVLETIEKEAAGQRLL